MGATSDDEVYSEFSSRVVSFLMNTPEEKWEEVGRILKAECPAGVDARYRPAAIESFLKVPFDRWEKLMRVAHSLEAKSETHASEKQTLSDVVLQAYAHLRYITFETWDDYASAVHSISKDKSDDFRKMAMWELTKLVDEDSPYDVARSQQVITVF